jgi:hypothetical protein
MAVFWLALYILVNLTSILYLGALAVSGISGLDFQFCMIALAAFRHYHYHWWYEGDRVYGRNSGVLPGDRRIGYYLSGDQPGVRRMRALTAS